MFTLRANGFLVIHDQRRTGCVQQICQLAMLPRAVPIASNSPGMFSFVAIQIDINVQCVQLYCVPKDLGEGAMVRTDASPERASAYSGVWKELEIPRISHRLGDLCFAEGTRHIPFEIARFFFIFDIPSHATRGSHAHRSIAQVIFAVRGAFTIDLENGEETGSVRLSDPEKGLLVGPMVWKGISDYAPGSVCLVVASGFYDEAEYLRSRSDWLSKVQGNRSGVL